MDNLSERREYLQQQVKQLEQIGQEDHYSPIQFGDPVFNDIVAEMFPLVVLEEACDRVDEAERDLFEALDDEWNQWRATCPITIDFSNPSIPRVCIVNEE